jgi:hypothetical protein
VHMAWAKAVAAILVLVMPGGLLFLLGWLVGKTYLARLREARGTGEPIAYAVALGRVRFHDVLREARAVSGRPGVQLPWIR